VARAGTGRGTGGAADPPSAAGPTPKLTAAQRTHLPALLAKGAASYDFVGDGWTTKRVAVVIKRVFRVRSHPAHLSRWLRQEGVSVQQPILRAPLTSGPSRGDQRGDTGWPPVHP